MRDAAAAKTALQDMGDAVKAESAAEVAGATQAAIARQKDITSIQAESQALGQLSNAAKQSNVQLLYGGRNDMTQHLADMAQELNYTTLLNRQRWLGFSSVQQAMSYRQQQYQLALLENKAHFAGYLTADQYLGFMQREIAQTAALSAVIRDRTSALAAETSVLLSHANAIQGTHQSIGSLGEQLGAASALASAITGVPSVVRTRVELDDSMAMAELAAYRAALTSLPHAESTDIISVSTRLGGVPLGVPVRAEVDELQRALDALNVRDVRPRIALEGGPTALEEAEELYGVLGGLSWERAEPEVRLDGGPEAAAEAAMLAAELAELDRRSRLNLGVGFEEVERARLEVEALAEEMQALDGTDIIINVDASGAIESIQQIEEGEHTILVGPQGERLIIRPEFDDADALAEMERFTKAFEDGLDAEDALSGRIIGDEEKAANFVIDALRARADGSAGGGKGPPIPPVPTPGAPPPDEGPDDAAISAWLAMAAAARSAGNAAAGSGQQAQKAGGLWAYFISTAVTAAGGGKAAGGWGAWTNQILLFGGAFGKSGFLAALPVWSLALHTLIDFFIVLVPAVIAASAALGAFALAAEPATLDVIAHVTALHTSLDALGTGADALGTNHVGPLSTKMGTLNATMKPMANTIRTMQSAMAPTVVTLFGAAINMLGGRMGLLQSIASKTGTWLEDMVIKVSQAINSHQGAMASFISTAVNDLRILGSIGLSLAKIFGELLQGGQMTHVSELLFEGLAYALSLLAKALNAIGPYGVAAGIAFFSLIHYGGTLVTVLRAVTTWLALTGVDLVVLLARLPIVGGAFQAFGLQASAAINAISAGEFLVVAAAIAAVGFAIYKAGQASSQAKAYVSGLQAALASDNASQGFAQIQANLSSMSNWLVKASASSRNFVGNMAQGWSNLFKDNGSAFSAIGSLKDAWEAITGTNQQPGSTALVLKEQTAEQKDWTATIQTAAYATKQYGTTAQQSFALMDLAGVKVTDTLAVQKAKVDDLVTGWTNMGVAGYKLKDGMNQLGAAVNAVSLASELSNSQISTLTSDFTSFLTLVTGGQTAFETFGQGILGIRTDWAALSKAGVAVSGGFSGVTAASLTLRQAWEANLTAGQTLYNNLMLQNAAAGNNAKSNAALAKSGQDVVSILLAQGGASQESVQGAYALAQTMGYTGAATYKALEKWSGGNTDVTKTTKDLNKQVSTLQGDSANLTTDVLNLAAAISSNLNQAIAQGLVGMPAMTKAVAGFYQYIQTNRAEIAKGITPKEQSLANQVANALVAVYGTSKQGLSQAKDEFLATLSQMGVSRSQALALWAKDRSSAVITPGLNLAPLHSKLQEMNRNIGQAYVPSPGWMAQSDANQGKIVRWFADSLPHASALAWGTVYTGFFNDVWHPIGDFLNKIFPGWITSLSRFWAQNWVQGWHNFYVDYGAPLTKFFTSTFPSFISNTLKLLDGMWSNAAHYFGQYLVSDVSHFFTSSLPDWFSSIGRGWNSLWSTGWADFSRNIVQPMEHWFTTTMPDAIWGGLKSGIDKAIGGMNSVIGFINSVTGVVGVHIGSIPSLAGGGGVPMASGSVPGTGDEDGTHIIAMGGEYMLRKPARMALQAEYGPDFLDRLNQADSWLGSGSRGSAATQRRPANGRYAGGGGILSGITNWLGTAGGDLAGLAKSAWHGVTGAAGEVAKFGEQAVFDAMWDLSGKPAEAGLERLGTPGAMGASWLQDIHGGVENWIGKKTSAAQSQGHATPGHPSGSVISWIDKALQIDGYPQSWEPDLLTIAYYESGYNTNAQNNTDSNAAAGDPSRGIMQEIMGTFLAYHEPGTSFNIFDPIANIASAANYIHARYGSPAGTPGMQSIDHGGGYVGYAGGGPVIDAIRGATSNREEQESMALGSWLLTRWHYADSDKALDEYGPFLTSLKKHKGFTAKDAINPSKAARLMAPYYHKGVEASTAARWKKDPAFSALTAAMVGETGAGTRWHTPSHGEYEQGWKAVTDVFRAIPERQVSTINQKDVSEWASMSAKFRPEWDAAFSKWQQVYNVRHPSGVTKASWEKWLTERKLAAGDEKTAGEAMQTLFAGVTSPQNLNAGSFAKADQGLRRWSTALAADWLPKKYRPEFHKSTQEDILKLDLDVKQAGNAWSGIWGNYVVPGIHVRAPGNPVTTIDLNKLIVGAPFGQGGSGGGDYGFGVAAGGVMPSLSSVAAMFGGGMASGGMVPDLAVPGLSATLQQQLAAQASGEMPRTLADAAGGRAGLHVGQLTINNPKAEKPSDSITRASNRLAFMAGRGIALWAGRTVAYTGSHASQVRSFCRYALRPACCPRRGRVPERPSSVHLCLQVRDRGHCQPHQLADRQQHLVRMPAPGSPGSEQPPACRSWVQAPPSALAAQWCGPAVYRSQEQGLRTVRRGRSPALGALA
jgi:Transglycosylase SLT domain